MPSQLRLKRIADRIQQDLSEMLILGKVKDPRVSDIFITDVRVDRELAFANIFISSLEGSSRSEEILAGLKHAGGFIRSALASQIQLRSFPQLRFFWDLTPEKGDHIDALLKQISRQADNSE